MTPNEESDALSSEDWNELYAILHRLASDCLRRGGSGMDTTELLHEGFCQLLRQRTLDWKDQGQCAQTAAFVFRRALTSLIRRQKAMKRGGGKTAIPLGDDMLAVTTDGTDLAALLDALEELAVKAPRQADVVTMRYLAGMTEIETANELDVGRTTVQSDWSAAKSWLYARLSDAGNEPG